MKRILLIALCFFFGTGLHAALRGVPQLPGFVSDNGSVAYMAPVWEYGISRWGNGTKQTGSLWGAAVGYGYSERDGIYFRAEFSALAGRFSGSAGNDPTQEYITELRFGYVSVPCCDGRLTLTPFFGAGSYVFNQTLSGPDFRSYFWYLPFGFNLRYRIGNAWAIGFTGFGAPSFGARYKITNWKSAPVRPLWFVELPATYFSLPFECSLIPFFKSWAYRHRGDLISQRNLYYGIKAAFGYRF